MIKKFLKNHQELVNYVFFGVLTTLINLVTYRIFTLMQLNLFFSVVLAWLCATIFSFISNKFFVFNSKQWSFQVLAKELSLFLSACIFSLGVDLVDMWVMVDLLLIEDMMAKFISNVIGTIINYILRKFLVFKKS